MIYLLIFNTLDSKEEKDDRLSPLSAMEAGSDGDSFGTLPLPPLILGSTRGILIAANIPASAGPNTTQTGDTS